MYNFIDVTEVQEGSFIPAEALKINGEFIENQIDGYRTLYVKGREALSPELDYFETGVRDGAVFKNKRYPARIITVGYQIIAADNASFREAYNKLGSILNVNDAELIFNDELDKFYTGTPTYIDEVDPGKNAVVGEFEITCLDPFKYSVAEYEATSNLSSNTILIDYGGTYKSYPTLEADFYSEKETSEDGESVKYLTGNGDCGYVAFFNEGEKIIQLGDPEEDDGENLSASQTLIYQTFTNSTAWGTAAKGLWTINGGKVSDSSYIAQTGSLKIGKMNTTDYYLTPSDFGSGSKFHGPCISRQIPADASNNVGASNFTFSCKHKMCIGSGANDTKQRGMFQILLTDVNNKTVAGISIYKNSDGKKASLRFYVNSKTQQTIEIDLSYNNKYYGTNSESKGIYTNKTTMISKSGSKITFTCGGIQKTFIDSAIADTQVTKINITIGKYGSKTPLIYNGIRWVKFVKNNCEKWKDIKNKFTTGDIVIANCKESEIYLNDVLYPKLGALGNDWEDFCLTPGLNEIGFSYSDWVADAYKPTFKVRYREVFL